MKASCASSTRGRTTDADPVGTFPADAAGRGQSVSTVDRRHDGVPRRTRPGDGYAPRNGSRSLADEPDGNPHGAGAARTRFGENEHRRRTHRRTARGHARRTDSGGAAPRTARRDGGALARRGGRGGGIAHATTDRDRKSTRMNSSH